MTVFEIDDSWCPHKICPGHGDLTREDITFIQMTGTGDKSSRPTIEINCSFGSRWAEWNSCLDGLSV